MQFGLDQDRVGEIGALHVCAVEHRLGQVGADRLGPGKTSARKGSFREIGAAEIGVGEVAAAEIGVIEIWRCGDRCR